MIKRSRDNNPVKRGSPKVMSDCSHTIQRSRSSNNITELGRIQTYSNYASDVLSVVRSTDSECGFVHGTTELVISRPYNITTGLRKAIAT